MVGGVPGGPMFRGFGIEGIGRPGGPERPGRPYGPERPGRPYGPERPGRPYGPEHPRVPERIARVSPYTAPEIEPVRKVEPILTRKVNLAMADPSRPGAVEVRKIKLDPKVRPVIIDRALALQIGRGQKQFNEYRYQMSKATVSLDRLLHGKRGLERALAGLVARPDSRHANACFRRLLPAESPVIRGRVRFPQTAGPRITRIPGQAGSRLQVHGARGLQIGINDVQRNKFGFRVIQPELSLAHALRDNAGLTRTLATALGTAGNKAAWRSLEGKLATVYNRHGGLVSELRGHFRGPGGLSARGFVASQFGLEHQRVDKVALDVRKVVLTGWGSAGELARQRPGGEPGPGLLRGEQDHLRRVGLTREIVPDRDMARMADTSNMIVPTALHGIATAAVSAFAPGRRHMVPRLETELSAALSTAVPFEPRADRALKAPVVLEGGVFRLATEPRVPEHRSTVGYSVELGQRGWIEASAPGRAMVLVADVQRETTAVTDGYEGVVGIGADITHGWHSSLFATGPQPAPSAAEPQALPAGSGQPSLRLPKLADSTRPLVSVVLLGSALLIASGRRVLDADTLVCFARRVILRCTYDGSPSSAAAAMRLACALEIVVLLDLALNGGIWVDLNPETGAVAATLLIDGLPGDPGGTMRFLHPIINHPVRPGDGTGAL